MRDHQNIVQVQVDLPRPLHTEAKTSAVRHETTLRAWILDAIRGKLGLEKRGEWPAES